jgi:tmRNA-binding protein
MVIRDKSLKIEKNRFSSDNKFKKMNMIANNKKARYEYEILFRI